MQDLSTKFAQTQADLVELSIDKDVMKDEFLKNHHLTTTGFYLVDAETEDSSLRKMEQEEVKQTVMTLFQCRPTARIIDIKPSIGTVEEVKVMDQNRAGYRMSYSEKSETIASLFARDRRVQGYRYELSGLDNESTTPCVSLWVYIVKDTDDLDYIPSTVFYRYRKSF